MTVSDSTVAVTGSNGYVGGIILDRLRNAGFRTVRLERSTSSNGPSDNIVRPFSLGSPIPHGLLNGVDTLIHCAYDFRPLKFEDIHRINVEGSIQLFQAAVDAGVNRIIFISTLSAFDGCKSLYGKAKLAIERTQDRFQLLVVRPGLVYGDDARGMMGSLTKLASLPFFIPLVGVGNQIQYLAHEQDLSTLIQWLVLHPQPGLDRMPIIAANESGKTLRQILQCLSEKRGGGKKLIIPIPWRLLWASLKSAELAGIHMRTRSDSLISLLNQDAHPDFTTAKSTGVAFRDFDS